MSSPRLDDPRPATITAHSRAGVGPLEAALRVEALRRDVEPFVRFVRSAHAIAHGRQPPADRLAQLDACERALVRCYHGEVSDPSLAPLGEAARRCGAPIALLLDVLLAMRREAVGETFATMEQLVAHARRSAGACGRLLLYITGQATPWRLDRADDLGVALRLLDVVLDVHTDARAGRVLVPAAELHAFDVAPADLVDDGTSAVRELLAYLADVARSWLARARPLLRSCEPPLTELVRAALSHGHAALLARSPAALDPAPLGA